MWTLHSKALRSMPAEEWEKPELADVRGVVNSLPPDYFKDENEVVSFNKAHFSERVNRLSRSSCTCAKYIFPPFPFQFQNRTRKPVLLAKEDIGVVQDQELFGQLQNFLVKKYKRKIAKVTFISLH